jgi:hypothetical protein
VPAAALSHVPGHAPQHLGSNKGEDEEANSRARAPCA